MVRRVCKICKKTRFMTKRKVCGPCTNHLRRQRKSEADAAETMASMAPDGLNSEVRGGDVSSPRRVEINNNGINGQSMVTVGVVSSAPALLSLIHISEPTRPY